MGFSFFVVVLSLSLFISSFEVDALDETEVSSTIMMMMNRRSASLGWCCAFHWHDEEKGLLNRREPFVSERTNEKVEAHFLRELSHPISVHQTARFTTFHWPACCFCERKRTRPRM
jgi:hypothetical protein